MTWLPDVPQEKHPHLGRLFTPRLIWDSQVGAFLSHSLQQHLSFLLQYRFVQPKLPQGTVLKHQSLGQHHLPIMVCHVIKVQAAPYSAYHERWHKIYTKVSGGLTPAQPTTVQFAVRMLQCHCRKWVTARQQLYPLCILVILLEWP